jgi:hypothetical protein
MDAFFLISHGVLRVSFIDTVCTLHLHQQKNLVLVLDLDHGSIQEFKFCHVGCQCSSQVFGTLSWRPVTMPQTRSISSSWPWKECEDLSSSLFDLPIPL